MHLLRSWLEAFLSHGRFAKEMSSVRHLSRLPLLRRLRLVFLPTADLLQHDHDS